MPSQVSILRMISPEWKVLHAELVIQMLYALPTFLSVDHWHDPVCRACAGLVGSSKAFSEGLTRPELSTLQPKMLFCNPSSSISSTVSPAQRKLPTARQNLDCTSCLSVPNTCELSTYWTCQKFPAGWDHHPSASQKPSIQIPHRYVVRFAGTTT